MYLYVELWKPKPSWDNLSAEQRSEFLSQLAPGVKRMKDMGVELVGFSLCDADAPFGSDCRYMAVWKMPNLGHAHMLDKAVRAEGWDNYFDILHARGEMISIESFIEDMLKV